MEGAALAGAGQRDRPRKGGKRTKASKAQELFEEEVKRLVKLIDVKLTLQGLRNVVEYEEALKSALASSASGTYGGMLVDVYVGVVSGSSPEAVKLGYEHVRRKLRGVSTRGCADLCAGRRPTLCLRPPRSVPPHPSRRLPRSSCPWTAIGRPKLTDDSRRHYHHPYWCDWLSLVPPLP